ncbi:MAG: ABC transporter ATP-binding protein [Gemmatimonadaceae bacterium]|nr:ABC transporter ATP-binding protein [Gemmatimonadaceae bacterium]
MARHAPPPVKSVRERFGALRHVIPLFGMVWRTSQLLTLSIIAVRLVRALLPVATLYIGKLIIDEVIAKAALPNAPTSLSAWLDSGLLDRALWLIAAEFALAIVSDLAGRVGAFLDMMLGAKFSIATSVRLMQHAATLDLEQFEDSELQDRLERARTQASSGLGVLGQVFGQVQNLITIISFGVGMAVYAPWLIALLFLALVPAFLGEAHFNARDYALQWSRAQQRRELEYLRQTGASVETAKEVKIFGLNTFLIERFTTLSNDFFRVNRRLARQKMAWMWALTAIGTVGYYAAYAYIAWRTLAGQFTIGDLTFLAGSFRRLSGLLESLLIGFSSTASQALYLDDLFSFFTISASITSPTSPRPVPRVLTTGIEFRDVGFQYPGAPHWAVRHLSFTLRAGETLALVGENGAGKTTLVKLLARLYDPDEGVILVDGHDLREYSVAEWRSNVGVIFQDFVRYSMTAGENVAVGRIEQRDDLERVKAAAARSLANEVIERLPEQYAQRIGKRFRNGVDLSGGEWQKIAIARAYMRDAQLLILDEPTAALDARAEFEVFQRFKELSTGKSSVLISHRFSSVRMADRILVLDNGMVEASGTHDELVAQGGRYAELFELQAAGYR